GFADDGALRAEEGGAAEGGDQAARGRAVAEGEDALPKVEQHPRVVVTVAREALAAELAFLDQHAGHRADPPRGAEDAGKGVEAVDGHVVERAAAGLAPVPDRADVREHVAALAAAL